MAMQDFLDAIAEKYGYGPKPRKSAEDFPAQQYKSYKDLQNQSQPADNESSLPPDQQKKRKKFFDFGD